MKLIQMTFKDAKEKCKMPEFQRKSDSRVNSIAKYMGDNGEYASLPIVVNNEFEVIDGGHRLKAFFIAFEDFNIKDEILVLVDDKANKDTFLRLNLAKPVSFAHKVKIHDAIEYLEEKVGASFTVGRSTKLSIGTADFARGLFILKRMNDRFKQCSQKEAFDVLDNIDTKELKQLYVSINRLKNRYFENIGNRKFMQKLFLYLLFVETKIKLSDKDIERAIERFPNSLGGDIGLALNKEIFIEAFNFNKKKNRLSISIFDK